MRRRPHCSPSLPKPHSRMVFRHSPFGTYDCPPARTSVTDSWPRVVAAASLNISRASIQCWQAYKEIPSGDAILQPRPRRDGTARWIPSGPSEPTWLQPTAEHLRQIPPEPADAVSDGVRLQPAAQPVQSGHSARKPLPVLHPGELARRRAEPVTQPVLATCWRRRGWSHSRAVPPARRRAGGGAEEPRGDRTHVPHLAPCPWPPERAIGRGSP